MTLLAASALRFSYDTRPSAGWPAGRPVVDEVSLEIGEGALVAILGPNGSGKTTLLKLLSGVLRPTGGTIRLDGSDMAAIPRRTLARRIATVPQETQLAFDYSALEIVLMGRYPHLGPFELEGPADLAAAYDAMQATGTRDLAERGFATLSGGEKQRVVIAAALAQVGTAASGRAASPSLLLLDEPTASLDLRYQLEIASLVERLNAERNIAVVLSTHDLRLARLLARTVVLLSAGRVLAQGPVDEVLTAQAIGELYGIDAAVAAPILAS